MNENKQIQHTKRIYYQHFPHNCQVALPSCLQQKPLIQYFLSIYPVQDDSLDWQKGCLQGSLGFVVAQGCISPMPQQQFNNLCLKNMLNLKPDTHSFSQELGRHILASQIQVTKTVLFSSTNIGNQGRHTLAPQLKAIMDAYFSFTNISIQEHTLVSQIQVIRATHFSITNIRN